MKLKKWVQILEKIAPPEWAEEWDNTGLLIEPLHVRDLQKILLTIDLTETVAREAVKKGVDAIMTYHPLFFGGITALTQTYPQARSALRLIEQGIAVYSPHTALDAAPDGVNDWLADTLGEGCISCAENSSARIVELTRPVKLSTLGTRVKQNLHLHTLRLAEANHRWVKTIAVCAGAGIEALTKTKVDCWLTGEMKHHDVIAARENGIHVILCGHTETERGYLKILRRRFLIEMERGVEVLLSKADTTPLKALESYEH